MTDKPGARNRAGRAIWFVPASGVDAGGVYRAVTPEGRRVFVLAVLWTLVSGVGGMAGFAATLDGRAFAAMFVAEVIGLALTARAVIRHS